MSDLHDSGREFAATFDELDLLLVLADDTATGLFIDVGAHIGRFSVAFARRGWRTLSFEPAPHIADRLEEAMSAYPGSIVMRRAVSDVDADAVTFHLSSEHWGIHSLSPFHESHRSVVTVPVSRLDSVVDPGSDDEPVFLKIDAEGADFLALRSWDFAHPPVLVMCEFMDERSQPAYGYGRQDIVEFMAERGYAAFVSEWTPVTSYSREGASSAGTHPVAVFPADDLAHEPAWGNLIFVPTDRRSWFEAGLVQYLGDLAKRSSVALAKGATAMGHARNAAATIANREARIDALVASRDAAQARIDDLAAAIDQRDVRISELDAAIVQRGARISELDAAIVQRDARISELDAAIVQRDARISELSAAIVQRDARISELMGSDPQRGDHVAHPTTKP